MEQITKHVEGQFNGQETSSTHGSLQISGCAGRTDGDERRARPYWLGQRSGVYSPGCARVARACGSQDALHRAWVAAGERLASFNGKLRDDLLDREVFYTLLEVRVLTERFRRTYNRIRPHSSLGYRPPAPEALLPVDPVPVLAGLT
ncbi:MAG: transposase [Caldilineaceae bacterium SB0675_bin_29]|uniref:Transposase n=1 Tax=Caldilineaceae bacterium SB0675_bin_29 TaxID=2605266 RepID=A0A6B1GD40_9CHLR|nr:transposase [Caldilineaceae bacterium SB0675_bin_29]